MEDRDESGSENQETIVKIPAEIGLLLTDRKLAKKQTAVKITSLGNQRIQIDHRAENGKGLRKIVLDVRPDKQTALVTYSKVRKRKVDDKEEFEGIQEALEDMAKAIITE
jgi:hypothetical protein